VKARRPPVALLAVLALLLAWVALPEGGSAAPAPTAACAAILAPRPAVELPVQVAPGLSVRVRDPYGGLIARSRLFVAFSVRYRTAADRARIAAVTWTLDGAAPRRDEGGRDQLLAPSTMYAGRSRPLRASALSRGGRSLRIAALPPDTTAVRVRLAAGVVAPGHRCSLSAWLRPATGAPAVRVVQRC